MTITSPDIINQLIRNNGYYKDDPRVVKIVKYTNHWGGTAYGVIHQGQNLDMYKPTKYVIDPQTIFIVSETE